MAERDLYVRIIRRITKAIVVIGLLGTAVAAYRAGWRFGLGFLSGAGISYLSFWRWRKVVESLGGEPKTPSLAGMMLRFALVVAAAYAIVKYLEVSPAAVFLGLLVSAAAVLVSIVFELFYAGT